MMNRPGKFIVLLCLGVLFFKGSPNPEEYNKSNDSQFKRAIKALDKLELSGSENVLDIGSGDGRVSSHIAREYIPLGTLTGIDNSSEMISFASKHNAELNTSYECIDGVNYNLPNTYDAIVSFWALHWVSDYEKVLDNIATSLKPGGKALLCHGVETPIFKIIAEMLLETERWSIYKDDAQLLTYPSLRQVSEAISKSGLIIENLEIEKTGIWMPQEKIINNWNSLCMFDFIPSGLRKQFCQEILDEFIHEYPLNEKNEVFRWTRPLVMILKKPRKLR